MFQNPLAGLKTYSLSGNRYSEADSHFPGELHSGEDWSSGAGDADIGDPVRAAGPGVVQFAHDFGSTWGKVVVIQHLTADGKVFASTVYGHLNTIEVSEGSHVDQGQVVGGIGTGNGQYAAHLHFGLYAGAFPSTDAVDGYAVDPTAAGYLKPSDFLASESDGIVAYGRSGDDAARSTLVGGNGTDHLFGTDGNDFLEGRLGGDFLIGGRGADTMLGGAGDDTFLVDNTADVVAETTTLASTLDAGGLDTVRSEVSWTLGSYIERLVLTGSSSTNGTGNELDNVIMGNDAANTIEGRQGNDKLFGGGGNDKIYGGPGDDFLGGGLGNDTLVDSSGADVFFFNTAPSASNVDTIIGFDAAVDKIYLDNEVFTEVGPDGPLAADAFVVGTLAHWFNDRIIYDPVSQTVYYDSDGLGVTSFAVEVAKLELAQGTLTSGNFLIV